MQKYMHWCIDSEIALVHISPIETQQRIARASRDPPLFNNQCKKQQTALPLPATGDQTAPKGCPRQGEPCTADDGETPKPSE
jgi:hypothetical protein